MRAHSGLQVEVLRLYRDILRYARSRGPEERRQVAQYARDKFTQPVKRTHVTRIEYLLGYGRRQLDMLKMSGTKRVEVRR